MTVQSKYLDRRLSSGRILRLVSLKKMSDFEQQCPVFLTSYKLSLSADALAVGTVSMLETQPDEIRYLKDAAKYEHNMYTGTVQLNIT